MKLTILGTGDACVTECFNTCFVLSENDKYFMVDGGGGNGILRQLKLAGIDRMKIKHIFVTHKHLDHILGALWMIRMICQDMAADTFEGDAYIYGHDEVIGLLRGMAKDLLIYKQNRFVDDRIHMVEVHDGESMDIIGHRVTFFDIMSTKSKQYGFTMELADGEKLTCCGDEPFSEHDRQYAEGSTWLLHESFCRECDADIFRPYEMHHSTVKNACELAEDLGAKHLVLYHTEDVNIKDRRRLYYEEGVNYYHGDLIIAEDLQEIEL
ncbi:MAG: MBL fold metallo-hydrolase [Lachnospiraceae bacterium]|nr:MBL fold metallo-hydrolase [Lachnospiraceae bacterium]